MQKILSRVESIYPEKLDIEEILKQNALSVFDEKIIDFLETLSSVLFKDSEAKGYPDLITFAFWCRRASLSNAKKVYQDLDFRLGRGIIFHIAPSNVPINFAYSLVTGLLAGNINIVRVPSKQFKQVEILCRIIKEILSKEDKFKHIKNYINLIRYERDNEVSGIFSKICNVRVIWGGDSTINEIRKLELQPRAFDVTFSDRYSLCVINSKKYLEEKNKKSIANSFYNDTYLMDQNACTTPHLIIWNGTDKDNEDAKEEFWNYIHDIVKEKYNLQPISVIDKLAAFYNYSAKHRNVHLEYAEDNYITRVKLDNLNEDIYKYHSNCGYFMEYNTDNINELKNIVNQKYQTLSYYGFEALELKKIAIDGRLTGIDRIVRIGKTMEFSLKWDGYDLIYTLSRIINVI